MKKLFAFLLPFIVFVSLASPAFAQTQNKLNNNPEDCLYSGGGTEDAVVTIACVIPLFANAVYWLLILSGTVALFFIIFGGIRFLTSGGDPKSIEAARKIITWAIIGLVVVLLSFGIVAFIAEATGVRCITNFGFTACYSSGGGSSGGKPLPSP